MPLEYSLAQHHYRQSIRAMQRQTNISRQDLQAVAAACANASRIAFFTGAGISAESGLPTYRGIGGLYNDITVDEGLPIEEVLSGVMFNHAPEITWKYIAEIERACRGAQENAAHYAITALEEICEVTVITQNVDGFHRAAKTRNVIELHGNLSDLFCLECDFTKHVSDYAGLSMPPVCDRCNGMLRPSVVLFGEMLLERAVAQYDRSLMEGFDVLFSIGTTAGFPYIYEPVARAARRGVTTVEINPDRTPLSDQVAYRFALGAGVVLDALLEILRA